MDKPRSIGDMLREFHDAFDLGNPVDVIRALPHDLTALRMRLHDEENGEMYLAARAFDHTGDKQDLLDLAKEAADVIYVGAGTLVALGMDPERVVELVHNSNMTKLHECTRCHGEGELEVGAGRDSFGNWDTETVRCDECHGTGKVIVKDKGGKVVKPDTYEDPNLEELLHG